MPMCFLSAALRPRGPPYALTRGDPWIPAPFARLASLRSLAMTRYRQPDADVLPLRGASPPRTPLRAHSRGPLDPRSVRAARVAALARDDPIPIARCR